jgi:hypothetical protein
MDTELRYFWWTIYAFKIGTIAHCIEYEILTDRGEKEYHAFCGDFTDEQGVGISWRKFIDKVGFGYEHEALRAGAKMCSACAYAVKNLKGQTKSSAA